MDGAKWSWILLPGEDIEGSQDLRIELWTVNLVNEQEQSNVIWHHSFQIDTNTASGTVAVNTNTIIVVAIIIVIMILLAVVIFSRGKSPTISTPLKHAKPTVFMSYRRTSSWGIACTIHQQLTEKGADVFIDINDINEGRFDEIIAKSIKERDFFILVMAPDTLESEWVMREVQHAIACNKKIIPVLVNGFNLYDYELPKQVGIIGSHNAVTLTPEFLHAGINRIGKFIGLGEDYSD